MTKSRPRGDVVSSVFDGECYGRSVRAMNPFSAVSWLWRAWRTRSITAAALFAFAVLGISVLGGFRHLLHRLGAPWYVWIFLPLALVATLARKEAEWMPDEIERRKWARRLVVGAIVLGLVMAKFAAKPAQDATPPPSSSGGRADPHGR